MMGTVYATNRALVNVLNALDVNALFNVTLIGAKLNHSTFDVELQRNAGSRNPIPLRFSHRC
jgi:hypothetical protein